MATFILTWNPARWDWDRNEYQRAVRTTGAGRRSTSQWSVGLRKQGIDPGDRAFLLRQRRDRGIIASGRFVSGIFLDWHWDGSRRKTTYARVKWDTIVDPADRLLVEALKTHISEVTWDRIQGSGVELPNRSATKVERMWAKQTGGILFHSPDEVNHGQSFPEGSVTRIEVNRYERDPRARAACLARWGAKCSACGLDFESRYGEIGSGFIHVHHLRELSSVPARYRVDPVKDLRPVCPNCHAMLHRIRPALTIRQLKSRLSRH